MKEETLLKALEIRDNINSCYKHFNELEKAEALLNERFGDGTVLVRIANAGGKSRELFVDTRYVQDMFDSLQDHYEAILRVNRKALEAL